jgi:hypothetical protein
MKELGKWKKRNQGSQEDQLPIIVSESYQHVSDSFIHRPGTEELRSSVRRRGKDGITN